MPKYQSRASRASNLADHWRSVAEKLRDATSASEAQVAVDSLDTSELEYLKEEMESWRDNQQGTALENTGKFQEVSDCCDALDQVDVGDVEGVTVAKFGDGFKDECGEMADILEQAAEDLEAAEFPGMY